MATKHQLQRLQRLSSALRKILEFAQARNADGSFRQGSTATADAFRKANKLTGYRGPAKARPTFGPRNLKADVFAALAKSRSRFDGQVTSAQRNRKT